MIFLLAGYLTGMVTGPDCVGVGSNCSHIRKPPGLQSAAWTCLRNAFPRMRLENSERNHGSLKLQDAGTFQEAPAQGIHSKSSLLEVEFRNFGAKAEYSQNSRLLQLQVFCLKLHSWFIPSPFSTARTGRNTSNHVDSDVALKNDARLSTASYDSICCMTHYQSTISWQSLNVATHQSMTYYVCCSERLPYLRSIIPVFIVLLRLSMRLIPWK